MRTVGVEEELLLVDERSGVPQAVATAITHHQDRVDVAGGAEVPGGTITAELQQEQIEIDTTPVEQLIDLAEQIRTWRRRADELAQQTGARIAALATSPLPVEPQTTIKPRYQAMVNQFGLTTTEQLTCGCHIHVAVESPEAGIAALDRIRVWLPVLLALSANSPFWQGVDSGYASFRSQAWHRFPSAGPTERFGTPERYWEQVDAMVSTGVVLDRAMVYFDARLSDRYPTVEVRVADVCLDAADTVLLAALARALVETAVRQWEGGQPAADVPVALVRLAGWRAGRSALDADLLDPRTNRPRAAAAVVGDLVDHVGPALQDLGDAALVEDSLARLLSRGTGAATQRTLVRSTGGLAPMVRAAVAATVQ